MTQTLWIKDNVCYNVEMRKEKEIIIACASCRKQISLPPYRLRQGAKFCSQGCQLVKMHTENKTHNLSTSKVYKIRQSMLSRCHNPKDPRYHDYGQRGITVCVEWVASFEHFWNDIKNIYKEGLVMDRIDNEKGYFKGNIRFVSPLESQQNTRRTRLLTFKGETLSLSAWGRKLGVSYVTIIGREKRGMPIEKILQSKI